METKLFNPKTVKPDTVPEKKIQPKLEVNPPNDKYEQEADQVADRVSRMPSSASDNLQMLPKEDEDKKLQMKSEDEENEFQMKPEEESIRMKPEEEEKGKIQMISYNARGQNVPEVSTELTSQLNSTKGQGSPLSGNLSKEMGQNIGGDFSNVRVHTDSNAVQMNKELGAKAFTHGNDIYFNNGKYNPESSSGKKLLAHELTHVIQQNNGKIRNKLEDTISLKYLTDEESTKINETITETLPKQVFGVAEEKPGKTPPDIIELASKNLDALRTMISDMHDLANGIVSKVGFILDIKDIRFFTEEFFKRMVSESLDAIGTIASESFETPATIISKLLKLIFDQFTLISSNKATNLSTNVKITLVDLVGDQFTILKSVVDTAKGSIGFHPIFAKKISEMVVPENLAEQADQIMNHYEYAMIIAGLKATGVKKIITSAGGFTHPVGMASSHPQYIKAMRWDLDPMKNFVIRDIETTYSYGSIPFGSPEEWTKFWVNYLGNGVADDRITWLLESGRKIQKSKRDIFRDFNFYEERSHLMVNLD